MLISFKTPAETLKHKELIQKLELHGGKIIQYHRVTSAFVLSFSEPIYEWIPDNDCRKKVGRKHAMHCALLGWWFITGIFETPVAIYTNLKGGVDVTQALISPPPLPEKIEADKKAGERLMLIFLAILLITLIAVVTYFCVR